MLTVGVEKVGELSSTGFPSCPSCLLVNNVRGKRNLVEVGASKVLMRTSPRLLPDVAVTPPGERKYSGTLVASS